jgi:hypothetical protein
MQLAIDELTAQTTHHKGKANRTDVRAIVTITVRL